MLAMNLKMFEDRCARADRGRVQLGEMSPAVLAAPHSGRRLDTYSIWPGMCRKVKGKWQYKRDEEFKANGN